MSAIGEWIEYAHFDARVSIERSDRIIAGNRVAVVHQNTYAYAAVRYAH